MSVERQGRDHPLEMRSGSRRGLALPGWKWVLRLRLRWARQGIDALERQLASEFATLDTAPLHAELDALRAERDALLKRLGER